MQRAVQGMDAAYDLESFYALDVSGKKLPRRTVLRLVEQIEVDPDSANWAGDFNASILKWDFSAEDWVANANHQLTIAGYGSQDIVIPKGERYVALYQPASGKHVPSTLPAMVRFELKDALTPGGNATAYPLEWDDYASDYQPNGDVEFTVYDPFSRFRGRGKDAYGPPHDDGSRGVCRWFGDRQEHEIVQMFTPHATMIIGDATADYDAVDFHIDGAKVMQPIGGIITNTDPAGNISIVNLSGLVGDENDTMVAVWDEANGRYIASLPIFDDATMLTNFQVSGLTLQKKTRQIHTMHPETESAWTTVHTGTECP